MLIDDGISQIPVEIKSAQTIASDFFASLKKWCELSGAPDRPASLVYAGDKAFMNGIISIVPWRELPAFAGR